MCNCRQCNTTEEEVAAFYAAEDMDREYGPEITSECRLHGCDWQHTGGRNCGCEWKDDAGQLCHGNCSVPVNRCSRCGDFDYGDNADAVQIRTKCAEERAAA